MSEAKARFRLEGEDSTAAAFRSALGRAKDTSDRMGKLFTAAFAGISVAAVVNVGRAAVEFGDNLGKAIAKSGIGSQAMQELAFAAKMADVDLQGLSTSLRVMQVNLSQAAEGNKAAQASLAALALNISDLRALAPDKQFELLADRISQLKDPADRARAATELFGRAGADLLPLFEKGAAGIRQAREEAQALNQVLSDEQLQSLQAADDSIKRLDATFSRFATTLTAVVAPALSNFFDSVSAEINDDKVGKLRASLEFLRSRRESSLTPGYKKAEIDEQIAAVQKQLNDLTAASDVAKFDAAVAARGQKAKPPPGFKPGTNAAAERAAAQREAEAKALAEYNARFQTFGQVVLPEIRRQGEEMATAFDKGFGLPDIAAEASIQLKDVGEALDEATNSFSVYTDQAQRNMQDALANFFMTFDGGIKGLGRSLLDVFRQLFAQKAAEKLLGGLGVGKFLDGLFGFADGGSFTVPGGGPLPGVDSQLVAFRARPGERVDVSRPGQQRGGGGQFVYAPVIQVDARADRADVQRTVQSALRDGFREFSTVLAYYNPGLRTG